MTVCRCGLEMVEITMATPEAPVRLQSCGACDHVDWQVGGEPVARDQALDQLASTGRR